MSKKDVIKLLKDFQEDIKYVAHDYTRNKLSQIISDLEA